MEQLEESKIIAKIIAAFPAFKGNLYDEYKWCEQIVEVIDNVKEFYLSKSDGILKSIIEDDISDDTREIVFKVDQKRNINMDTLKENVELFEKISFIKESDVARIVGRSALKDLVKTTIGEDKYSAMLQVNITDLESELGKKEAAAFIDTKISRNQTPLLVEKGKYSLDHYKLGQETITEIYINENMKSFPKSISRLKV